VAARGVAATAAGGVGSVIGGGKFENGAVTAAYGYLFNELAHRYQVGGTRLCYANQTGCTMSNALKVVDAASTPIVGGLLNDAPQAGFNNLLVNNPIDHYVDEKNFTITNTALPGHDFYPGTVVHSLSMQADSRWSWSSFSFTPVDAIYLTTVGTGTGAYPSLNNAVGSMLFNMTHMRSQNYFRKNSIGN
jgi:hypothetical protein